MKTRPLGILALAILCLFLSSACRSIDPHLMLGRETRVCVSVRTDDLLQIGMPPESVRTFANRVNESILRGLDERGIPHTPLENCAPDDARLTVELKTLEPEGGRQHGLYGGGFLIGSSTQNTKVSYLATFVSKSGTTLCTIDALAVKDSLDALTKKIGNYVAKRVAAYYDSQPHASGRQAAATAPPAASPR